MNNKELLFNLLKAKDKQEIEIIINGSGAVFLSEKGSVQSIFLFQIKDENIDFDEKESESYYEEKYNEPFKENFYKEKGLDKCWYKDCQNKIYQSKEKQINIHDLPSWVKLGDIKDWKGVYIQCQDKHKRYICLDCYDRKINQN